MNSNPYKGPRRRLGLKGVILAKKIIGVQHLIRRLEEGFRGR